MNEEKTMTFKRNDFSPYLFAKKIETGWVDQEKDPKKERTKPSDTAEHKGVKGEAGAKVP